VLESQNKPLQQGVVTLHLLPDSTQVSPTKFPNKSPISERESVAFVLAKKFSTASPTSSIDPVVLLNKSPMSPMVSLKLGTDVVLSIKPPNTPSTFGIVTVILSLTKPSIKSPTSVALFLKSSSVIFVFGIELAVLFSNPPKSGTLSTSGGDCGIDGDSSDDC